MQFGYWRRSVAFPLFLYSVTGSMFFPVFQSLTFFKVCSSLSNNTGITNCYDRQAAKNQQFHTEANTVMLVASIAMNFVAVFTSLYIGWIGDTKSRKLALSIPFIGLVIADVTLLCQAVFLELSPYYFAVSELLFGMFGGYMSVFSASFAYLTSMETDQLKRSTSIAKLEGLIGLGGMIGFLQSSQVQAFPYHTAVAFFLAVHSLCLLYVLFMEDPGTHSATSKSFKTGISVLFFHGNTSANLRTLVFAFGMSYFALIGTIHILFFYLKQRFYWDTEYFGYLRASTQACSTAMALFLYPALKRNGVRDVNLALFGLVCRALGKLWLAIAWSGRSVFVGVIFECFSRFPATAIRSMIASNVTSENRGSAFCVVGCVEALASLLAAVVFHSLFPWSIAFLPQISFILMALLLIPPICLLWFTRNYVDCPQNVEEVEKQLQS